MEINIPEFSLVVLIGPTLSGKTTFARKHFTTHEIISSDLCRAMISDDPTNQSVSADAFDIVHSIADKRLKNRRLTVIDATSLQSSAREPIVQLARDHNCPIAAIVFDLPQGVLYQRNNARVDRQLPNRVISNHVRNLRQAKRELRREGIRRPHFITSQEQANQATLVRVPMRSNHTHNHGPFDIIGDIHGCYQELHLLLAQLGYQFTEDQYGISAIHPQGRTAVFVGDLVDRGPAADLVLQLVMNMTQQGFALSVIGNHEDKLLRTLRGNPTTVSHGLQETLDQIAKHDEDFRQKVIDFIQKLPSHLMLDDNKLAVAHAGITENYQGRFSRQVSQFAMYGETTGETDEWGLPVRLNWAANYRGRANVVYGHTPVLTPQWFNGTINVDTGCVFGGKLSALRYPEEEIVSVAATKTHYEAAKPIEAAPTAPPTDDQEHHLLLIDDVLNRQPIETALRGNIAFRREQGEAALETISRFAVDPRWMIYVPPTMAPCATNADRPTLEHPAEAFDYFRESGVDQVVCQEKHMGSRAIVIAGRDQAAIRRKFGIDDPDAAICYTRTGRPFFNHQQQEVASQFYTRVRAAIDRAGIWDHLETDWIILDCELMPWSYKALGLLRHMYAATGSAAANTMQAIQHSLQQFAQRGLGDPPDAIDDFAARAQAVSKFRDAYRHYCWTVESIDDIRLAPFHVMATAGRLHTDQPHSWHMEQADLLHTADPVIFTPTQNRTVALDRPEQIAEATDWWENMTHQGGEGIVIKPMTFIAQSSRTMIQPAVKCRGPEYLRIIYGPEYNLPHNLDKLRHRSLRAKQAAAVREFALGVEGLQRFVDDQPLHRVHQCAFGVIALDSEPMDPRL